LAVADAASTLEDTSIVIDVIANDTDVDNANTALRVAAGSITNVHGGTAALQGDGRTVRFTPALDANDGNSGFGFSYRVSDGSLSSASAAPVTISVTAVNDPPVALPDSYSTNEDTQLIPSAALGLLAN